ncbi:MAG: SDR family NAD(P)-dependent oxidoreductase [SAR324 cluster bacterium]|nr:SDR family NAD(P)-dependent oxidoreductase [SAR324 cluster bacterium]MEE2599764.1 SDR family NAD(P)-dependent oxidoreductase [SAR324 cluster bacterium]
MGFDIEGDKFIVTGAARGIGLEISRKLSELGAKVSGWDLNHEAMASEPAFTHRVKVDVTDERSIQSAVKESIQKLGGLQGLIANAGINGPTKPIWEYSKKEWEHVMSVDLTGVFLSTKAVLHHMKKNGYGRLIIISSVAGKEGNPGATPYGAAKAGVIGYAKGLAQELLPSNITVNCLAPAITETELLEEMTDEYIEDKKSKIPMGRFCTAAEIADMTAWVASSNCSFTTGQVFDLTGGRATY